MDDPFLISVDEHPSSTRSSEFKVRREGGSSVVSLDIQPANIQVDTGLSIDPSHIVKVEPGGSTREYHPNHSHKFTISVLNTYTFEAQDETELQAILKAIERVQVQLRATSTPTTRLQIDTKNVQTERAIIVTTPIASATPVPLIRSSRKVTLEDFEVLGGLGEGAFGVVSKVRNQRTDQIYAMKKVNEKLQDKVDTLSELRILSVLDHHYLVGLNSWFMHEAHLYLVLDYVGGGDLFTHLRQQVRFSEDLARFYLAEIICGLEYLHKKNIVYRDLKPENLLLGLDGHIKITDFGLAKAGVNTKNELNTNTVSGTPQYLAPEVLKGEPQGPAVDWWTTGILLFEMLTGEVPFSGSDKQTIYQLTVQGQISFPSYVSKEAKSFIRGVLVRNPANRLGCGALGSSELKNHSFFKKATNNAHRLGFSWTKISNRTFKPPTVMTLEGEEEIAMEGEEVKLDFSFMSSPKAATRSAKANNNFELDMTPVRTPQQLSPRNSHRKIKSLNNLGDARLANRTRGNLLQLPASNSVTASPSLSHNSSTLDHGDDLLDNILGDMESNFNNANWH